MDSESQLQSENLISIVEDQIRILFSLISRPIVMRQFLIAILIIGFAWILSRLTQQWHVRVQSSRQAEALNQTKIGRLFNESVRELFTPLLILALLNIAIRIFEQLTYPKGFLEEMSTLIFTWLLYRVIVMLLRVRFGTKAHPYLKRIVTPVFLFLVTIEALGTLPSSVALADFMVNIGRISFPFIDLVTSLIVLYIFIVSAWLVQQIMQVTLPQRLNIESGLVESVATLTRYSILATGIIVALSLLGLDFTSLAIVAGGLSVGIGIGLQDIVANFVSGLVLLFEQSIRPGDVIELDGRISKVDRISLRATTLRTRTNEEVIVPNATFTSQAIKNLTKSDRLVQAVIPISVSYDSDPEMIQQLTVETSLKHPNVLSYPAPSLAFSGYGESSLDFNLLVSTTEPELSLKIRSDLYYMLWQVFTENGITIPFPQRDLNIGVGWDNLVTGLPGLKSN